MITIPEKEVIKVERDKIDTSSVKRKSKANSYRGHLVGNILKCKNDGNIELQKLYEEELKIFNRFYPLHLTQIEIISGWKGEGSQEIYKGVTNNFMIKEPTKDKHTGEIDFRHVEVKKEDLNRIILVVKSLALYEPYKCYYIAKKLGFKDWKELWKERKLYFKMYYYPIKVCEALNLIKYGGKGTITRLK